MGQRDGFSAADIRRLNILYDCDKGSIGGNSGSGSYTRPPPIAGTTKPPVIRPPITQKPSRPGGISPIKPIKPIRPFRPSGNSVNSARPGFGQAVANFWGNIGQNIGNALGFNDNNNQTTVPDGSQLGSQETNEVDS